LLHLLLEVLNIILSSVFPQLLSV